MDTGSSARLPDVSLKGIKRRLSLRVRAALITLFVIGCVWLPVLFLKAGFIPDLLFLGHYQADLLAVLSIVGILGTLACIAGLSLFLWTKSLIRGARQIEKNDQAAAHREFLQRLDHEMKNPLTTIRIGVLNVQQTLNPEQQGSLIRIAEQTQRLQRLVEDLRYLTEIEEYKVEPTPVDLREVLESTIALACSDPERQQRNIELHIQQVPWPLPDVYGDPELLFIVFRNLLDNALKYTEPEDKVIIRTTEDGRMILVEVADAGMGIPADDLSYVFDDLYRGQNARGVPGNGLGLALAQRIVNLHAGKIEINSRLHQGTILRVWLPSANKG